jgi:hypothetical protein
MSVDCRGAVNKIEKMIGDNNLFSFWSEQSLILFEIRLFYKIVIVDNIN